MDDASSGSTMERVVGGYPEATSVVVMGAEVRCLLDTWSQLSTLTESYYRQHMESNVKLVDISSIFRVNSSQGSDVPFIGYVELDANIMGRLFPGLGFLIVRDPTDTPIATRKMEVPGVIGSNIFRVMNAMLTKDGTGSQDDCRSSCDHVWSAVLALYEEQCVTTVRRTTCNVRVAGKCSVIVPARSVRSVPGSGTVAAGGQTVLWRSGRVGVCCSTERVGSEPGVFCCRSTRSYTVFCCKHGQRISASETNDTLGCMQVVQSTDGILPDCGKATASEMATGRVESASTAEQLLGEMDIGDGLGPEHRLMLVELIDQYFESFSQWE